MENNLNRDEVFQLFLGGFLNGKTFENAFKVAVSVAQAFDREMAAIKPYPVVPPKSGGGKFAPSGLSVYFCSHDGVSIWIASYPNYGAALAAAISMNESLESAKRAPSIVEPNSGGDL